MKLLTGLFIAAFAGAVLLGLAWTVTAEPLFVDGFEPSINGNEWPIGPTSWWHASWPHEDLKGDISHIRTPGINSARVWVNYHVTYNSQHFLNGVYGDNHYLKCWIFEDNDIPFGGYFSEYVPNSVMALLGTDSGEFLSIGVMGSAGYGIATKKWFLNCAVESASDGKVALDGTSGTVLTPRRQGWRKYTILINGYTGNPGDVQYLIDDKVVFNGTRAPALPPDTGGAKVDTIVLGLKSVWTYETYWFDQIEFGTIEIPVPCATIAEAKELPDGTWVQLDHKVVTGCFTKSPFPGYFAVEENDRSAGLWVSSSYQANVAAATHEAEDVSIKGIMYTNEAGMRYLDAIEVTRFQTLAPQPRILGTTLHNLEQPNLDGKLVKVWGRVIAVPNGRIAGRITDPIGNGVSWATISVYKSNDIGTVYATTSTNGEGYYSIDLPPWEYNVKASKGGYQEKTAGGAVVLSNYTTDVSFSLMPNTGMASMQQPSQIIPVGDSPTAKGQERPGDWRRYFLIDDGSPNSRPIKCYYDNIISGTDPVPNVNIGDFVSVVGVAGSEVLASGLPPERSIWIRKAGDLVILNP